jgi:ATP-dependent RNA helicase DHX8/PRP22
VTLPSQVCKQREIFDARIGTLVPRADEDGDTEAIQCILRECRRLSPPKGTCLPFYSYRSELVEMITSHRVSIVVGHTGSGKSTQMVQYIAEAGLSDSPVICTQPRKLAARSLAKRVGEEWGSKDAVAVGCGGRNTLMKFCTCRNLLNEILKDRALSKYGVVVVDEAHERTIDMDILLGMLKETLTLRGDDFRLVITSATINEELMSSYFGGCPVAHVPGATFPVEIHYANTREDVYDFVTASIDKALEIHTALPVRPGHILVFLTGQDEIDKAVNKTRIQLQRLDSAPAVVLPLHGKLPEEETDRVFEETENRKIIFSTVHLYYK